MDRYRGNVREKVFREALSTFATGDLVCGWRMAAPICRPAAQMRSAQMPKLALQVSKHDICDG